MSISLHIMVSKDVLISNNLNDKNNKVQVFQRYVK